MPGRKKTPVSALFKDIPSDGKVGKVKCLFCNMEVAKNGTRMMNHIRDCKKCDEVVKIKYLKKDYGAQEQDQSYVSLVAEEIEQRPSSSRQTSIDALFRNQSALSGGKDEAHESLETSWATSTPCKATPRMTKPQSRSMFSLQPNKINNYMDKMSDAQTVSHIIYRYINILNSFFASFQ